MYVFLFAAAYLNVRVSFLRQVHECTCFLMTAYMNVRVSVPNGRGKALGVEEVGGFDAQSESVPELPCRIVVLFGILMYVFHEGGCGAGFLDVRVSLAPLGVLRFWAGGVWYLCGVADFRLRPLL